MAWDVEGTDEFAGWWGSLSEAEQKDVAFVIELLTQRGPTLEFPYSSAVTTSRHSHMRELRAQHRGRPYRVLYAFDPRRTAILLLGGDKTGDDRWYEEGRTDMKTHKWTDLRKEMSPEAQREVQERVKRTARHLDEIRRARGMTQVTLASAMGVSQAQITKVEHQADLYVSTLRRFVEAMGGELELVARFPDGASIGVSLAESPEAIETTAHGPRIAEASRA